MDRGKREEIKHDETDPKTGALKREVYQKRFGKRLKAFINDHDIQMTEISDLTGISTSALRYYMRGDSGPGVYFLYQMAFIYKDLNPLDLLLVMEDEETVKLFKKNIDRLTPEEVDFRINDRLNRLSTNDKKLILSILEKF